MTTCEGARSGEGEPGWAWARGPEVAGGLGKASHGEENLHLRACVCANERVLRAWCPWAKLSGHDTTSESVRERREAWREMRVGWLQPACDGATCEAHG